MEQPSNGRSSKGRSYLIYAIGEIALVMIGILLALQVNNWNEDKQAKKIQAQVLVEIYQNLKSDLVAAESEYKTNNKYIENIEVLLDRGESLPLDSLVEKISKVHTVSIFKTDEFGYNKLTVIENSEDIPDTLLRSLSTYYKEYSDGLNNTSYEGLSKYSLDKFRDYLIQYGFPLKRRFLGNPDNPEVLKEVIKEVEFIGILRNTQYNRAVQQSGLRRVQRIIKNCQALLEAYFITNQIAY